MSSKVSILDSTFRHVILGIPYVQSELGARVYHALIQDMIDPTLPCFTFSRLPVPREYHYTDLVKSLYECYIWFMRGREVADLVFQSIVDTVDNQWFTLEYDGMRYGKVRFLVETEPDSGTDLQTGRRYLSFRVRSEALFLQCDR